MMNIQIQMMMRALTGIFSLEKLDTQMKTIKNIHMKNMSMVINYTFYLTQLFSKLHKTSTNPQLFLREALRKTSAKWSGGKWGRGPPPPWGDSLGSYETLKFKKFWPRPPGASHAHAREDRSKKCLKMALERPGGPGTPARAAGAPAGQNSGFQSHKNYASRFIPISNIFIK